MVACDGPSAGTAAGRRPADVAPAVVVVGPIGPTDVPELRERVRAVVGSGDAETIVCDVRTLVDPDLGTVDALARLALTGRRLGCRIRLCHATGELHQLLVLAGLAELLGLPSGLRLEVGGQAEQGEQASGVEERVDPGDAAV